MESARFLLVLASLAGCQLGLDGARCPCAAGWRCCPGGDVCLRDIAGCPGGSGPGGSGPGSDAGGSGPGSDAGGTGDDAGVHQAPELAPLAPTVGHPMYQGGQARFRTRAGTICTGRVAASMSTTGFCYLAASDDVMCAGRIGGTDYGMAFHPTGQTGATQILVMPPGTLDALGVCVARTDHTVQCMGGQFVFGGTGTSSAFTQWSDRSDLAAITTARFVQLCAITLGGQVLCSGHGPPPTTFGYPPVEVGPPGQTGVWVDGFGTVHLSDPVVLRPDQDGILCQVEAQGMVCSGGGTFGPTHGTVMGLASDITIPNWACWLAEDASVGCSYGARFAPGQVVFLAGSFYTDALCAIYSDGSVWCIGSNQGGKLGTGDSLPLATETMVAPPGSAHVACEP